MLNDMNRQLAENLKQGYDNPWAADLNPSLHEAYDDGFNQAVEIILDHLSKNDAIFDMQKFREISGVYK